MPRPTAPLLIVLAALAGPAHTQDADGLLPVEDAFRLSATMEQRDRVAIRFEIADGYYLYRERISARAEGAGVVAGALSMQPGERKVDEFFGEVEVYHDAAAGTLALQVPAEAAGVFALRVGYQGCHEKDPAICYPPHRQLVSLELPPPVARPAAISGPASLAPADTAALGGAGPLGNAGLLGGLAPSAAGTGARLPLPEQQAFVFEAIGSAADGGILARFSMPAGYYLYRDRTVFRSADPDVALGVPRWPPAVAHRDEHFGAVMVYFGTVEVPIEVRRGAGAASRTIPLTADFQGCQQDGICYPPMTRTASVDLPPATLIRRSGAGDATMQAVPAPVPAEGEESRLSRLLVERNLALVVLGFFAVGLGLAFTPCVYPMVPILSGILAGAGEGLTARRAIVLSLVYVLASALVYAAAGVVAGLLGVNLSAVLQKPWILVTFAGLFVLLALAMFGFYELQLPSSWQTRLAALSNRQKPGSVPGVAAMGVLSGLLVGPCVAPPLAVAVTYIGQSGDPVLGGFALFAMGLGMGAPLLAFGATQGRLLPKAGPWMDAIKSAFGVAFLFLALWMLERVLDPVWIMLLAGILLVGCGVHLGALERLPEGASGWRRTWKAVGVALLALGVIQFIGVAAGGRDVMKPLAALRGGASPAVEKVQFQPLETTAELDRAVAAASTAGKPVLFDFYADWCVECKRMERNTFTDAGVREALSDYVLLKVDVTAQDDDDVALQRRFGIIGPPATLFFHCGTDERREHRLVGYEDPAPFAERLRRASQC
ncbi:MAG: protein-disulfide reductase DsbD [Pseudomonadota bacterium]